jgi:hypothetical protein
MQQPMKKKAQLIGTIIFIAVLAVIYTDSATLTKKRDLYNESIRIEKLISKYDLILNKMDGIQRKIKILEYKKINDMEIREFLDKSKSFIKSIDETRAKQSALISEYNQIAKLFNGLPSLKILYSNDLPNKLDAKTRRKSVSKL